VTNRHVPIIWGALCIGLAAYLFFRVDGTWVYFAGPLLLLFGLGSLRTGIWGSTQTIRELTTSQSAETKHSLQDQEVDQCVLLGNAIALRERDAVDTKVTELRVSHPTMDQRRLRLRVWAVETSVFPFAAESSRSEPQRVDRFFRGFWPRIVAEVRADFPDEGDIHAKLDLAVEELVTAFRSDHRELSPEAATMAAGKRIASFLEIPDGTRLASVWPRMAIEYGHKMVAAAKLLSQLPS
jgi:hypothetical protein